MYGGFNGSVCQSCPLNSTNEGGYSVLSCECETGYSGPNGGLCTGNCQACFYYFRKSFVT